MENVTYDATPSARIICDQNQAMMIMCAVSAVSIAVWHNSRGTFARWILRVGSDYKGRFLSGTNVLPLSHLMTGLYILCAAIYVLSAWTGLGVSRMVFTVTGRVTGGPRHGACMVASQLLLLFLELLFHVHRAAVVNRVSVNMAWFTFERALFVARILYGPTGIISAASDEWDPRWMDLSCVVTALAWSTHVLVGRDDLGLSFGWVALIDSSRWVWATEAASRVVFLRYLDASVSGSSLPFRFLLLVSTILPFYHGFILGLSKEDQPQVPRAHVKRLIRSPTGMKA